MTDSKTKAMADAVFSFISVSAIETDNLKAMWNADWPSNDVMNGIYLEHVHSELTRRGEGAYCAV